MNLGSTAITTTAQNAAVVAETTELWKAQFITHSLRGYS